MASKIGTLKNDPNNSVNIVDLFSLFVPGQKTKYIELLHRITNELIDKKYDAKSQMVKIMTDDYGIDPEEFKDMSGIQVCFIKGMIEYVYLEDDLKNFKKFCEYNERGLIKRNDLSTYKRFEEVNVEFHDAEERERLKAIESQILKIYEDNQWLILRPLSYESSVKYGYKTKWCTASSETKTQFESYSKNGILIYTIDKINNFKVATHISLKDNELTFWNETDKRIDSSISGLPHNIIDIINNEISSNNVTNYSLFPKEETPVPWMTSKNTKKPKSGTFENMLESVREQRRDRENRIRTGYSGITGSTSSSNLPF